MRSPGQRDRESAVAIRGAEGARLSARAIGAFFMTLAMALAFLGGAVAAPEERVAGSRATSRVANSSTGVSPAASPAAGPRKNTATSEDAANAGGAPAPDNGTASPAEKTSPRALDAVPARPELAPESGFPQFDSSPPSTGLLRVTVALAVTLAGVLLVAAILKRSPFASRSADLLVEHRLAVARGAAVAVVRVEGRRLLVGITAAQINLIAELGDVSAPAAAVPGPRGPGGFERLLGGLLRRGREDER